MEIKQNFVVSRPLPIVWDFFHDVPKVAECLPGAEYLGPKDDGSLMGKVSAKVGPFQASFEGEAKVTYDEAAKKVDFEGKGVDRKGASRGKMSMVCTLEPEGDATRVAIVADVQLSGNIAQFGRTGLLTEIANQLVGDFVRNAEAELAAQAPVAPAPATGAAPTQAGAAHAPGGSAPPAAAPRATQAGKPLSASALLFAVFRNWLRSLFRKAA